MTKGRLFLTLPLFVVLAFGCGAKNPQAPARVSGKVTYKGEPLKGGTLAFHTKDAGIYTCQIGSDGNYSIIDLPTGDLVVVVETESINPGKKTATYGKGQRPEYRPPGAPTDVAKADPAAYVKIPAKYANPKTSPLQVTLAKGSQVKDFELTD
jgi:hypothetical protein